MTTMILIYLVSIDEKTLVSSGAGRSDSAGVRPLGVP